jgi:hypothetical protein
MNAPKPTNQQEELSAERSDKTKTSSLSSLAQSPKLSSSGIRINYSATGLVPRSSLNYQEGRSSPTPIGEASPWSGHVTRILPPKEDFRKLLDNPSLVSEEAKEIERELAKKFGLD